MARSTRSQDALLALVVLLTLFAVPALEVYVQLTDREDQWGPAVRGLFGLGLALSIGLGYRKWQRDRGQREPRRHDAAVADGSNVVGRRPSQAGHKRGNRVDSLHVATLAVVVAFLVGAALTYFVVWPSKRAQEGSREQPVASPSPTRTEAPKTTPQSDEAARSACTANARYWCKNMVLDDVDEYRRDGLEPFDEFGRSAEINSCAHWLTVQCEFGRATLTRVASSVPDRFAVWCLETIDAPAPRCF